ncbi:MAG: sucrose-phosphate phosphatase [Elainellaceae cyanobacterium]
MTKFLFITDLDNTLVGDDAALERLNQHLVKHRDDYGSIIVYSTGRSPTLYQELEAEKPLISPDFVVLSVGTMIYSYGSDEPNAAWVEKLSQGWNREEITAIAAHFSDLVPQPASEQTPFKVSYFVTMDAATELLPRLESALADQGLDTQLVYSSGKDLDILPRSGNKGAATAFLQAQLEMAPERTAVCGDSGNDIAMFESTQSKGIIVGNAKPELRGWYQAQSNPAHLYLAQSHYAGGILEGLKHFEFIEND